MAERMSHESAMRHALELAARGPATGVNPRVGCVILSPSGDVLAEGWHRGAGTAHAEVDALTKLSGAASGATAVITLEPCSRTGRTGPCTEALIAAGIARVVYAVADPSEAASGAGNRLRAAGIDVESGVEADAARDFLRVWLTSVRLRRPFVSLKWAASIDGRSAASDGSSQWITSVSARRRVHEHRAAVDAILVGTGTVLADNPSLTARSSSGRLLEHQPVPVVVGVRPIPENAKLCQHPRPLIVAHTRDLTQVLADLFADGIRHVYVEGGPTLASAFVAAGLVDEYLIFLAPMLLGGDRLAIGSIGVGSIEEARALEFTSIEQLGPDIFVTARPRSVGSPRAVDPPRPTDSPRTTAPTEGHR